MLVLSRKANQRIVIGENIELVVVAVRGDRVQLGISAPSGVSIHREEVHRRIQEDNRAADVDWCGSQAQGLQSPITERLSSVSPSKH